MSDCSLCGLPTPDPPVSDKSVDGAFCCQGCLQVAQVLGEEDSTAVGEAVSASLDGETVSEVKTSLDESPTRTDASTKTAGPDRSTEAARTAPPGEAVDTETAFLSVQGMHCASCELFLESRASANDAVAAAAASYPAGLIKLTYDPAAIDRTELPEVLEGYGYRVSDPGEGNDQSSATPATERSKGSKTETETGGASAGESEAAPDSRTNATGGSRGDETTGRLLVGGFFGMMAMCWYALFLYPSYLGVDLQLLDVTGIAGQYLLWNVWIAASIVLGYTGLPLLRGADVSIRTGLANMDLLVALAAVTAYLYSTIVLVLGGAEVYFDITIVIVLAVTVGSAYEDRIRRRAAATLTDLTEERATDARRRTGDGFERVAVEALEPGEEVLVRGGERIPVDGTVLEGSAAVDESLITGESLPVRREPGDDAVGGALLAEGGLVVEVDGVEGTADRLLELLWDVQTERLGPQRLVDRLAAVFVPLVVTLAVLSAAWHLLSGATVARTLLIGLSVLVVSCPCALGLATPLAISAGIRTALEDGIVITDGSAFERVADVETVAFDKTGTLTTGSMRLLCGKGSDEMSELEGAVGEAEGGGGDAQNPGELPDFSVDADVLERAGALEQFADHPIADAITEAAAPTEAVVSDVSQYPGAGIGGTVDGETVLVGRESLFAERGWSIPEECAERYASGREAGVSPAMVGWEGAVRGVLLAGDRPRPEWEAVVDDLAADRRVIVISGDDQQAADRFRDCPVIDAVFAGVPPEAKAEIVDRLQAEGPVAMVGDGSNDAPALATADLGISLERGTRLAADAADAVVTTDDLRAVATTFDLLEGTRGRIRQNLAWALCYNAVAIPLAVTGLLNPLFAAVAMAASSLLVVGNSARSMTGLGERTGDEMDKQPNTAKSRATQTEQSVGKNRATQAD
jgi:Cu2+-exporting ATPase